MNWIWILILIPVIIVGVVLAFYVAPKTPTYVPKTTTTTTRSLIKTTTTTTRTTTQMTTSVPDSPCSLFKGECKTRCGADEDISQVSCESQNKICCIPRKIVMTTMTTSTTPGFIPT
ncbi:MAG: hypothetical protein V1944_02440 [Candidatus Aenigmatarchaeota archaeon]